MVTGPGIEDRIERAFKGDSPCRCTERGGVRGSGKRGGKLIEVLDHVAQGAFAHSLVPGCELAGLDPEELLKLGGAAACHELLVSLPENAMTLSQLVETLLLF